MKTRKMLYRCILPAVIGLIGLSSGCATAPRTPLAEGAAAKVDYVCWFAGGELADTTYRHVGEDEAIVKSPVFTAGPKAYGPVAVKAAPVDECAACPKDRNKGFDDHLRERLGAAVLGLRPGEIHRVELAAEEDEGLSREDRFLQLARVWRYPKREEVSMEAYRAMADKELKPGDEIPWNDPFSAKVAAVDGDKAILNILAGEGAVMETDWGPGYVRDGGDRYEVVIDAQIGRLVRTQHLVGRISEIDERHDVFVTDYGHPFGGETLLCDVEITPMGLSDQTKASQNKDPALSPIMDDQPAGSGSMAAFPGPSTASEHGPRHTGARTTSAQDGSHVPATAAVEKGDLATVRFMATLPDGAVVGIGPGGAVELEDPSETGRAPYMEEEVVAGTEASFPELGNLILGMTIGEERSITLPPNLAFGKADEKQLQRFPRLKRIPRIAYVAAEEYMKRFRTIPKEGKEVPLTPYFTARVLETTDTHVKLMCLVEKEEEFEEDMGITAIRFEGDEIVIELAPRLGSPFELDNRKGRIVESGVETFTVDFNHPLAGKAIMLTAEVVSRVPASRFAAMAIPWTEDHDGGLAKALREDKPVVLVLYASWCGWSKRLLDESLEDPRIKAMKDRFVWIKIDSDLKQEYNLLYDQSGYPLIVVLSPQGEAVKEISGFRPGAALQAELKDVLERQGETGPAVLKAGKDL